MIGDFTNEDLSRLLAQCRKETGGEVHGWRIIYHTNGPGGKSSGALTFSVYYSAAGRPYDYWNKTIREADHN